MSTSTITAPPESTHNQNPIAATDPDIWKLIQAESQRQEFTLEMIASENHASPAVMAAAGSCLTNKYCEGYPGKRYYSGCQYYDQIEQQAIDRARELFDCDYANVQPHSGANANLAVQFALMNPGDTFAAIELSEGGHLTHGSGVNISGKWFNPVTYTLVNDETRDDFGYIDFESVERVCREHKPKVIMCGYSAYPREIDFERFRKIADEVGAILWADIAHIAGLVAGGAHGSPFPHCQVVTTTTHKTLRGPRGGLILTNDGDLAKKFDKAIFPGIQGGPLMHIIAAKAVAFSEALTDGFKGYASEVIDNAQALGEALMGYGYQLASNGTDNHLLLMDLSRSHGDLTGKQVSAWLEQAGVIANKNTVPGEQRSPMVTSGIRLGSAALTTRGFEPEQMAQAAEFIHRVIDAEGDEQTLSAVRNDVVELCKHFPMPH